MLGHGPDAATFDRGQSRAELKPQKVDDTLAFMFETRWTIVPTAAALALDTLQGDYDAVWQGIARHFDR